MALRLTQPESADAGGDGHDGSTHFYAENFGKSVAQPPAPSEASAEQYGEYVKRPTPPGNPIKAVRWTGKNLDEVRKVYPGLTVDYMQDKGCVFGDYVVCQYKGHVRFWEPERFRAEYVAAPLHPIPAASQCSTTEKEIPMPEITHAYCDNCKDIQEASFEGYIYLDTTKKFEGGDICCKKCAFVISTLYQPLPTAPEKEAQR